jgi:dihydroorotate dehydrogenase
MYRFIRQFLFRLNPEQSHYLSSRTVMGLTFPNPIGLAAGLDKDADYVDALAELGFGFIEIGTVVPKPQIGNPKPRLFRLVQEEAIINRMGFNSKGVEYVVNQLEKIRYRGILGINIGKNKDTPLDKAVDDYLIGFRALWKFASYITINISSPNTAGLRDLQQQAALTSLLTALKQEQKIIADKEKKYIPLVVKISPDLSSEELSDIAAVLLQQKIDGVIAANTTITRGGVENSIYAKETGGLSGQPLDARNTDVITQLHTLLQNRIPIIAAGGIMDEKSARAKLAAGAQLLQIYTGFIYKGPAFIQDLAKLF